MVKFYDFPQKGSGILPRTQLLLYINRFLKRIISRVAQRKANCFGYPLQIYLFSSLASPWTLASRIFKPFWLP